MRRYETSTPSKNHKNDIGTRMRAGFSRAGFEKPALKIILILWKIPMCESGWKIHGMKSSVTPFPYKINFHLVHIPFKINAKFSRQSSVYTVYANTFLASLDI